MDEETRRWLQGAERDGKEFARPEWLRGDGSTRAIERVMKIFRRLDVDNSLEVSQKELAEGLRRLGYDAPNSMVQAVFDIIDEDATYRIGFGELKQWLMNDGPKSA